MANVQLLFLKRIYENFIEGQNNDLELVFQDGAMTASKICLVSLSPYFETMFSCDMCEKKTGVVILPTIRKRIFEDILRVYFINQNDVISEYNCLYLLDSAEMMQLDYLKSVCLDYLNTNLSLTTANCIDMWRSLRKFGMEDLAMKAFQYIVKNLRNLSASEFILKLTKTEFLVLLSSDDLSLKEDDVFKDVQKWIEAHSPSLDTMLELFRSVRFQHVSLSYLTNNVIFSNIVREHESIQRIVQEGMCTHCVGTSDSRLFVDNRHAAQLQNVMFVLTKSVNILCAASLTDATWYEIPQAPYDPGDWFSAGVLGRYIYITGGTVRRKSSMVYDVWLRKWMFGPEMKHDRWEHCMAVLADKLYVIGGQSNSIEQLQLGQLTWQVVGDLGCSRRDSCAEGVGENILVMGGIVNWQVSDNLQCFNTKTHAVCTIPIKENCGQLIRSFLHVRDLYLVHSDGTVEVVQIEETNTPVLRTQKVARHDEFGYYFGFVYTEGNIIVVTDRGLQRVNMCDGSKQYMTFQNTISLCNICGSLNMHVPRFCLQ